VRLQTGAALSKAAYTNLRLRRLAGGLQRLVWVPGERQRANDRSTELRVRLPGRPVLPERALLPRRAGQSPYIRITSPCLLYFLRYCPLL